MKIITLTQNKQTIVDDEDFEYLNQFKWHYINPGYVARKLNWKNNKRKILLIHRVIMNTPDHLEVDHINGNGLDNRKQNLRNVTVSQNRMNCKGRSKKISKYKGVTWHKKNKKWLSQLFLNGKNYYIGYFKLEKDAALAYNKKAKELFGEFAKLNNIKGK